MAADCPGRERAAAAAAATTTDAAQLAASITEGSLRDADD